MITPPTRRIRMGRAIANSTRACPRLRLVALGTELQVCHHHPRELHRAARNEGRGITLQNEAAREGGVLGPRIVEPDGHRHLAPKNALDRGALERGGGDTLIED